MPPARMRGDGRKAKAPKKTLLRLLSYLKKYTPTLIIAQRVASVQDADMIIILDNGQISAVGNHDQLMQVSSIYQEVYNSQQKGGLE